MISTKKILLAAISVAMVACNAPEKSKVVEEVVPAKMKMTTAIPVGIETPNTLQTEIGELNFFDGVPLEETEQKVYDYVDLHYGVEAFLKGIQVASMEGLKKGILEFGPANQTAVLLVSNLGLKPCNFIAAL